MNSLSVLKNRPEIRFEGFDDGWEQHKLGEIIQSGGSGGTPSVANQNYYGGEIPFLGIADIEGRDITHTAKTLTEEGLRNSAAWIVPAGAVSFAMYASVGKVGIIRQDTATSQAFYNMVFEDDAIRDFVFTRLEKADVSFEWEPYISTGTQRNLNADKVKAFTIAVPGNREAAKIGRYFENLDHLITLHQRKCDRLQALKSAMLVKMFPRAGSDVPEIRFAGFTDAWEQRKLSELYEKASRKNDLTYGKYDIISVANMYFKPDSYITDERYLLTYNIFELGDIAFEGNKSKNYAHGRFVENTIGNGIVSHVFDVFKPIMKPYDLQFWKYAINNERLMDGILLRSTKASTMMTNLVANDFLHETFLVPSYPEQQKIGAFFQGLDNLITLHQRKLQKLQECKKALLEKMFVGGES